MMRGMRPLAVPPASFVDPKTGVPAFGSYAGPLPSVDLGRLGLRDRIARRKKWFYFALTNEDVWISFALVRTGYATTAFAFVFDLAAHTMLFDRTVIAPPTSASVTADLHGDGSLARLSFGRSRIAIDRRKSVLDVALSFGGLGVEVSLDEAHAPPPISAIAELGSSLVSATEKRVLTSVRGSAKCAGRTFALDDAIGGYDYTHGLLPRHTSWRWGFAMGRTATGAPIAFNVVEGFVGEAECAAFYDGRVHGIAEPRFEFDTAAPERPWKLSATGIDLAFSPGAVHAQHGNFVIVKSRFVQPVGTYRGTLRVDGQDLELASVAGVSEDQDVLW
jgi:hypothetical protein